MRKHIVFVLDPIHIFSKTGIKEIHNVPLWRPNPMQSNNNNEVLLIYAPIGDGMGTLYCHTHQRNG